MAFNFGGFAGGLADGFNNGVRMGKTIRDVMKERKKEEFLKQAQQEAGAAWDAQEAAKGGLPPQKSDAPTSGPVDGEVPTAEKPPAAAAPAPAAPEVPAGNPYDPGDTRTDPKPAPAASPETAATQMPPSVGTQTPAAPEKVVQATPQQAAAGGMPEAAKPPAAAPAAAPAAPEQPRQPADPAKRTAFIQKEMGRRAYDYFVSQGDIDTAEKWLKHSETAGARAATRDWAAAYTAPDLDSRARAFGKYYTDHVNDGVDYAGHKVLTKEDGTQVAVVTLKNKATGKTSEMELTGERMMQLGEVYNPAALFKTEQARQAAADKAKIEAKAKAEERQFKRDEMVYKEDRADQREGIKATNTEAAKRLDAELDVKKFTAQERSKLSLKIEALSAAGMTDGEISAMMPRLVGADDYKKTTDPGERRALIMSDLTKNDPTFARLPEAEQRKRVDQAMRVVGQDDAAPDGKPAPAAKLPPEGSVFRDKQNPGRLFKNVGGKIVDAGPDPQYQNPAAPAPAPAAPAPAPAAPPPPPAAVPRNGVVPPIWNPRMP